jgi:hypothetical protein
LVGAFFDSIILFHLLHIHTHTHTHRIPFVDCLNGGILMQKGIV